MLDGIVVAELGLDQVGAEQGMGDEGAGQLSGFDVGLNLEAHLVAGQVLLQLGRLRRVEFDLKVNVERSRTWPLTT